MNKDKHVLVTVGTTQFESLIKATDTKKFINFIQQLGYSKVLFQIGMKGTYIPKEGQYFRVSDNISKIYREADLIITHGGAGTLLQNLYNQKLMVAIANDTLSGNHQVQIINELAEKGYIIGFSSVEAFETNLQSVRKWLQNEQRKPYQRPATSILNKLIFQQS